MESEHYELILDHFKNPRNYGTLENADVTYEEGVPSCGDLVRLDVKLEGGKIAAVKFSGKGCAISQASASILTEKVTGMDITEIMSLKDSDVLESLGLTVSPTRFKCALLGLKVLRKALVQNERDKAAPSPDSPSE
jgi:nitrogen fixation NifU-like protein